MNTKPCFSLVMFSFFHAYAGRSLFLLLLLLACSPNVAARPEPSFHLEYSAWNATHIVLATEGQKIDGEFSVIESWKGNLKPGEVIKIPGLASFKSESARKVADWLGEERGAGDHVPYVTGERMVLFLKEDGQATSTNIKAAKTAAPVSTSWQPVSFYQETWGVSVVWLERGGAYSFIQQMNPGDSLLSRLGRSEDEIKNEALRIIEIRKDFSKTIAIADGAQRAEALQYFAQHNLYDVREAAFEELVKCGESAIPVLEKMLEDDSHTDILGETVEALGTIGGKGVGAKFTNLVEQELLFWKRTGPALKKGWWNGEGFASLEEVSPLRNRYSKVHQALIALKQMRNRDCERVVTEFRDFWRSLPQLDDKSGLNQMSELCDEILQQFQQSEQ